MPAPTGSWKCPTNLPNIESERVGNPPSCRRCGSNLEHPVDVCDGCGHLVVFHGRDTEGCGRISAAGWCACRGGFARDHAEYVRYA